MKTCTLITTLFVALIAAFIAYIELRIGGFDEALIVTLPYVNASYFQNVGVAYLRGVTCGVIPKAREFGILPPARSCPSNKNENPKETLRVVVATVKAGAILGSLLSNEASTVCGWCLASGYRPNGNWPPPKETLPDFDGDVMLAIANVHNWYDYTTQYNRKRVLCVVVLREPFSRFQSLFQYALDGSELFFWDTQKILKNNFTDVNTNEMNIGKAVEWLYDEFGEQTMLDTHVNLLRSMARPECSIVTFEELTQSFEDGVKKWMKIWEINDDAIENIIEVAQRHNLQKVSDEDRHQNTHVSGRGLTDNQKIELKKYVRSSPRISKLLKKQSIELGYPQKD